MELALFHHRPSSPAPPPLCSSPLHSSLWPSLRPPSHAQTLALLALPCPSLSRALPTPPLAPRAYIESPNPFFDFFNKVRGALPVVGLLSRILSDEGGVGDDRVQFVEFTTRVYKKCTPEASMALYELEERFGEVAKPQYVLMWCWAAALGAGLLKSEDIIMGASRLRVSFDIQYEEEIFNLLMDDAAEKRRLSRSPVPFVPYEARAEIALEAICRCCIGRTSIDEEDARLLSTILQAVFPSVDKAELERLTRAKVGVAMESSSIQGVVQTSEEQEQISKEQEPDIQDVVKSEEQISKEQEQDVLDVAHSEEKTRSFVQ